MINKQFEGIHVILASSSPRRQYLLRELGLNFEVMVPDVEEVYPAGLSPEQIAVYLAGLKADSFHPSIFGDKTILITADTIVSLDDGILGKPAGHEDAIDMLRKLSGRKHEVITAVCLRSKIRKTIFHVTSSVYFKPLSDEEIHYYITRFTPFDKAGGYGIQEWIGYIGISRIEGSFFNVMGLPVKEVYEELLENYSYLC